MVMSSLKTNKNKPLKEKVVFYALKEVKANCTCCFSFEGETHMLMFLHQPSFALPNTKTFSN